ncbi:MAG: TonB-dependent receptor [Bacteroidales bacterium]|nr:TonB-dependent receptor [Bacteroidales bacterium]
MRGFLFIAAALVAGMTAASAQESEKQERLDSVVVSASRAGKSTPVSYTMVNRESLRQTNPINSLPMTLALQPSVVVSHEGGTGIGYSKLTVRGSKGSQINVTLNGITLNDGESQEVFWVNIPALTSILSGVQIQRGLGTSANGAGAFGASINMNTAFVGSEPSFSADFSTGSYSTHITTVRASSGLLSSGLYLDVLWSANTTEGYVKNGWGNSSSLLAVLGWLKENNSLRLTYLRGEQKTGITWTGVSLADMARDRRYNPEGLHYDENGNLKYYRNHTDNYLQQHLQLNYTHRFSDNWTWITTANYTDGYGFNERYKMNKKLSAYGFPSSFSYGNVNYKTKGDVIFRKTMDNGYWVLNSELKYKNDRLNAVAGVNVSRYSGDHYGELLWHNALGDGYDYESLNNHDSSNNWYFNNGKKKEVNVFGRGEYLIVSWLTAYADLQYRRVRLDMNGIDDEDDLPMDFGTTWNFFNPRAGLSAEIGGGKLYASVAYGNREPGRSDIKEVIESNNLEGGNRKLKPEKMVDFELGYNYSGSNFSAGVNLYMMEYRDMLLETGELSASGYAIKDNVDKSYRRGVELSAAWQPSRAFGLSGNVTFSSNKILDYTKYYEVYDNLDDWGYIGQQTENFDKVTMLMSPSVTAAAIAEWSPLLNSACKALRSTKLSLTGKYVGKQYWDNTESSDRCIPSYFVSDASLTYELPLPLGSLGLGFYVNNLFGKKYYADAWVYRAFFQDGGWYQEEGVFPQAPRNFMFKISYKF